MGVVPAREASVEVNGISLEPGSTLADRAVKEDLSSGKTLDLPAKSPSCDFGDRAEANRTGGNPSESVQKNIDLEVMELRASLQSQGLFRDAIEEICNEKRQRLLEEHQQGNM